MLLYEDIQYIEDRRVVMLQSGGLESCYVACLLSRLDFEIHHVFIDYGQNAVHNERASAKRIVDAYGGTLHEVKLDMPWLATSTILNSGEEVKTYEVSASLGAVESGVYVPMRNTIFLSIASSLADSLEISYLACGLDGYQDDACRPLSGAPDKHPLYVRELERALSEGSSLYHTQGIPYDIITPTMNQAKAGTILRGQEIDCDFSLSWTCYNSTEKPCGTCCACVDRLENFERLNLRDPLVYVK